MIGIPAHMRDQIRAGAPDPEDATRRVEMVLEARAAADCPAPLSADALTILVLVSQHAPYLARLLARDPGRLDRVSGDLYLRREKPAAVQAAELAAGLAGCPADDPEALDAGLRRYRGDELVRLGARELELGNRSEVGRELAHLSDTSFDHAIAFHDAVLRQRYGPPRHRRDDGTEHDAVLAVIGMGKLGGEELNFASDVDVIYVYSGDAGGAGDLSLHEYFSKLCERVTASIGHVTEDDVVFRVDLRLRPEGGSGAIANSLGSTERYYEAWGRPWERQAWIKARACAGDRELGRTMIDTLRPFVYPRMVSPSIIDDVTDLNRRIKAELDSGAPGTAVDAGFDLKNGVGGIREIEFFVQALQLIHAPHNPSLRSRTTLVALDQLFFAGLVSEAEHRTLDGAYRYLRHAEHIVQLESGRQTQRIPESEPALGVFARRMGHADTTELGRTLAAHTGAVAELFATLGVESDQVPGEITVLLTGELGPEQERELLGGLGFRDPEIAQHALVNARRKPLSPFHYAATGAAGKVAPGLLAEICAAPDPDQALRFAIDLANKRGSFSAVWGIFADNPLAMRLIASLFGTSEYLSKAFVARPDLLDMLIRSGDASARATTAELEERLAALTAGVPADDLETRWNRLADLKLAQVLRVGLADIAGELSPDDVGLELSKLAEVILGAAWELVRTSMRARHGVPREGDGAEATLSIVAMGKLGARELGYASDLDLIFVYSGDGESDGPRPLDNVTYFTRLAQRLMSGLHAMHPSGRLYEVDTRLRPSGTKGLLVSSLAGWERYHGGEARLWERQALIKLRPVAGDLGLGTQVSVAATHYAYGRAPGQDGRETERELALAIVGMRDRMERELGGGRGEFDLKVGRGGIVDVEFAAQYLQLVWGPEHQELRCQSTIPALRAAADLGLADAEACQILIDGYRVLRRIENRLRIVHDRSINRLPPPGRDLDVLARRTGHGDGEALRADCDRWMGQIRAAYICLLSC
ncbi:MAG TPA: bifunctional [glutamate--ammonia ligase]-adenylyl-L-tyrosine phosphorylase/[glutamate--ammonia-ligase] adenylyltransferase [Kofleriaceae bacterium]|nr:bifunctional [glutamate--ammonia ligase]-adenylyl-L-tyrosine phosphorylase/[glutamate--ammonia-ligase] adenylyltransferase [Kofleriaceae bacterium]